MVAIVDSTIVLFHIRHQVVDDVLSEYITAKTHLGNTSLSRHSAEQLRWVTIGKHDNHFLCLSFGQQVVEDVVHPSHLIIYFFRIGGTTDQIENRILLVAVTHIAWWQINHGLVGAT